jgi:hypothetical protein
MSPRDEPRRESLHRVDLSGPFIEFRNQLEQCTLTAICGRQFVLTARLNQWLRSTCCASNKKQFERLLYADWERRQQRQPEVDVSSLRLERDGLILFSILLDLQITKHLGAFCQRGIVDGKLPMDLQSLKQKLREHGISEFDAVSQKFYEGQWKFFPAIFRLHDSSAFEKRRIVPIILKEFISEKGLTADLLQVEVLADFVEDDLKAKIPQSSYERNDGLGKVSWIGCLGAPSLAVQYGLRVADPLALPFRAQEIQGRLRTALRTRENRI